MVSVDPRQDPAHSTRRDGDDPLDLLGIGDELDDTELLLQSTVRSFVADRILPDIAAWFEQGTIPGGLGRELGELGLLGMNLHGYGCAGMSAVAYGLACAELEAGDSGIRSFVSVQGSLSMFPIWMFGSEDQKNEWLPRMAAGEVIGCFGLTEPDSGSDPGSMRTRARRDGDDWILDGTKMWITNGGLADVAVVWARADAPVGSDRPGPIHGFIVPTDTPGFTANPVPAKLSLRASVTSELVLDGVRVPEANRLPEVHSMRGPLSCLNEARYGILWGATGAARACYEAARAYAIDRIQFDRPIASFQLTQKKLVELAVAVGKGQLLALHLGRRKDAGRITAAQISFGKMDNVANALAVARQARSILGANGITLEYPVIRHANNLESVYTYEGTNEVHTLVLGQAITGLSAFT